jgi:hypothetical protein
MIRKFTCTPSAAEFFLSINWVDSVWWRQNGFIRTLVEWNASCHYFTEACHSCIVVKGSVCRSYKPACKLTEPVSIDLSRYCGCRLNSIAYVSHLSGFQSTAVFPLVSVKLSDVGDLEKHCIYWRGLWVSWWIDTTMKCRRYLLKCRPITEL